MTRPARIVILIAVAAFAVPLSNWLATDLQQLEPPATPPYGTGQSDPVSVPADPHWIMPVAVPGAASAPNRSFQFDGIRPDDLQRMKEVDVERIKAASRCFQGQSL